jgi:PleD family two-component response regulator
VLGGAAASTPSVARRLEYAISRAARAPFDSIDASLGIAVHEPGEDPDRLVARADQALYGTKRRRRRESVA